MNTDEQNATNLSPDVDASEFATLGLAPELVATVASLGYEEPTAIQREAIPPLLAGRDVLGQAATGTGKTAAFALPLLHRVRDAGNDRTAVRGLVLVPTRELAMQVAEAFSSYGKTGQARVLAIYGGTPMYQQVRALKRGVGIVVATPGRALDHIRRETLDLSAVETVVLDEADEMLDMGFAEDLEAILAAVPSERQTALFSATMAPPILAIAKRHLRNPITVTIARELVAPGEAPRVREVAYVLARRHKVAALARVLELESPTSALVFCRTRVEVDELTETLAARGYRAEALHGGLSQEQRDRVMRRFRDGASPILVATDIAARGLDIDHLSHVVNFDVPPSPDVYVHRTGRTGRAGRDGVALTFAEPREARLLRNIEHVTKRKITIAPVPTVDDLRARRLAAARETLIASIDAGDLGRYRTAVESLRETHDLVDIAAAALKLADDATRRGPLVEEEIPNVEAVPLRMERTRSTGRVADPRRKPLGGSGRSSSGPAGRRPNGPVTRIYIGLGRSAGIRPADLVGAIANETGISSREIGAINIADAFSLVEVPDSAADSIVSVLRQKAIRGKKALVRRDRDLATRN